MDSNALVHSGVIMEEFIACFSDVTDPRQENIRHDLHEVLLIGLCTMLCGGEDCSDMAEFGHAKVDFLKQFLRLRHGIPSHDTFSRLFRRLDPKPFHACFLRFMERFAAGLEGVIAIDGKSLRRTFDRAAGKSPLHLVHAWATDQRLLLGQIATDDKSNEITAVPKLLEMLSLKGCIVTTDAMSCQRAICAQIVAQGGDYVIALKGNQGTLHADVRLFLKDPNRTAAASHTTVDANHGRIETRTGEVCVDIAWLQKQHNWPGIAAIAKIVRTRESKASITLGTVQKSTTETTYYLLSTTLIAQRFTDIARAHWGIENRLHWVLDVTMNEDRTRHCKDNGPENIALLRRLALNLAKIEGSKGSMKGKLKRAGWNNTFLATLLAQFNKSHMR